MALSRETGKTLWEQGPGLVCPTTAWLVVDDTVVANSAAGTFLCIDATTGQLRYNHVFARHVDADQPRRLEPVLRNGALFVPQHQVHVVRPRDGELIGTVPSDLIPDLLRVDERSDVYVYIAEESGHLAAFGAAPKLTLVE
jgi:outer membrane protein assembly factor BamB